jgi:PAS domain S-box-containing protein
MRHCIFNLSQFASRTAICCFFSYDDDTHPSNMVSPEESVDGNAPTTETQLGVPYQASAGAYINQSLTMPSLQIPAAMMYNIHPAVSMQQPQFPPMQQPQFPPMQNPGGMMYYQVVGTDANDASLMKRRRLEMGEPSNPINTTLMNAMPSNLGNHSMISAMPQAPVPADRRRERNKILARRTRLRKKFFFEGLQKEVIDLQRENDMLKDIVRLDIGGTAARDILDSCDAVERLPEGVMEACREGGGEFDAQDFRLVKSIESSQQSFIITDPSLTDNPIVFASEGFLEVTGYARDQVLGRNCRFLQGAETRAESVDEIRHNLSIGEDVSLTILNYAADGTPFWNKQFIAALRDSHNNIVNYIGVIVKVASPEPGHPDYGKVIVNGTLQSKSKTGGKQSEKIQLHDNNNSTNEETDAQQYDTAENE